jgi:ELWxxDGT repeat protein
MVAIGSTAYFTADDGVHGVELWRSDGTAAGTVLVKDTIAGSAGFGPRYLTNVNGTLFFMTFDGTNGTELWKSDGTAAGTVVVKDINPGNGTAYPSYLTNVNGTLFFRANDGTTGFELWKSDGTAAGTVRVKDINPGSSNSYPRYLTNVNGTLFFTANDGRKGSELWKSNGTASGTVLVKDINSGSGNSSPSALTNVNGTLFFSAWDDTNGRALWKSDGSAAGTSRIASVDAIGITNLNGLLFFSGFDVADGTELWKSDGTAAGTALLKDIYTGSYPRLVYYVNNQVSSAHESSPHDFTNVNGTLFFAARDAAGIELWQSDGTEAGTTLVKDIDPGGRWLLGGGYYGGYDRYLPNSSDPGILTNVNGTLYFRADDGANGTELWKSDGTAAGTTLVKDINPGTYREYDSYGNVLYVPNNANPSNLTNVNGTLFFSADDGVHGQELWVLVDDQAAGTNLVVSGFPATVTAGVAGSFTVAAMNADGSTNTSYRGRVQFSSSDPQAVLPANYTFTAADQGVHTFSATLKTAGSQSITTRDTVSPISAMEPGIAVKAAAASKFTLTGFPSPITAGTTGSLVVTAVDPYGNRTTGYTRSVRFTSSDAKAVLPGNYTFTAADAGTHTFSVVLKTAGTQSLTATDTANAAIVGAQSVTVNPAAASRFVLRAPASVNAGAKFSLTVTVVDAYGNVVTGYRGKISWSSSDSTANLPNNYTFTASDLGVHTFTGLVVKKKGTQSITVTDTLDGSLTASVLVNVQ